jgi:Concanavalin A-like lectin/glucanases superfamily
MRSSSSTRGVSEVSVELLLIVLVVALAIITYAAFSGTLNSVFFKKSVYIAGNAAAVNLPRASGIPDQILSFTANAGDPFYLTGQTSHISGSQVTLQAIRPDGVILYPDASSLNGSLYGQPLYIYPSTSLGATACNYMISNIAPTASLPPLLLGTWKLQLVDPTVHVLVGSYTLPVNQGTSSLPGASGFATGGSGQLWTPQCTLLNATGVASGGTGSLPTFTTAPDNMTYAVFNGTDYLQIQNDPSLSFTGALTISMWFNPTTNGTSSDSNNWHQIIGKGVTNGVNDETDNYQVFQYGNQLLFEWNDATNPSIHYQAITPPTIAANQWNYLTVTVAGGQLAIYNNGVQQTLAYDQSNVPGVNPIGPVSVNLLATPNDVTVGKQIGAGGSFYYVGDIGSMALYNRAITGAEITNNLNNYTS